MRWESPHNFLKQLLTKLVAREFLVLWCMIVFLILNVVYSGLVAPSELRAIGKDALASGKLAHLDASASASTPILDTYNDEHYNSISLTGVVCENPVIKETRQGKKYAFVLLGQIVPEREWVQSFSITFWDKHVEMVMKQIHQGTLLAVKGSLSEFRNMSSITASDFYFITRSSFPYSEGECLNHGYFQNMNV